MKYLFIINNGAYGNELAYNGFRLAMSLQKEHSAVVSVFLMGDGVTCAMKGQKTPDGYYNLERMIKGVLAKKGEIYLCGTCMDARGINEEMILPGTKRSTMVELSNLVEEADKVMTF